MWSRVSGWNTGFQQQLITLATFIRIKIFKILNNESLNTEKNV